MFTEMLVADFGNVLLDNDKEKKDESDFDVVPSFFCIFLRCLQFHTQNDRYREVIFIVCLEKDKGMQPKAIKTTRKAKRPPKMGLENKNQGEKKAS